MSHLKKERKSTARQSAIKSKIHEVNGDPVKNWGNVQRAIRKTGEYASPAARRFLNKLKKGK